MLSLRPVIFPFLLLPLWTTGAEVTGTIYEKAPDGVITRVPARLVIESLDDGKKSRFLAVSGHPTGTAVPLEKKRPDGISEVHTALSADPWKADPPPGRYRITASRGHEYRPASVEITVPQAGPVDLTLERWVDMASRGWFSGDVHCHLPRTGLETVILAADLNVTFPLGGWVTDTAHFPNTNNKVKEPWPGNRMGIADSRHVFWSANTEYELFTQNGAKNALGALLILRHRDPLALTVPPLTPLLEKAREEGAILDLEKHNWPWSMVLPAIGAVDLFELANNHLWESGFGVTNWYTEYVPDYMCIAKTADGRIDERGWLSFGLQNWYALLNCGLKIAPSAGTGAGVHPVAPGFGRVYVRMPDGTFDFDEWCKGLKLGRSFVTTGPMLFLTVAEKHPGAKLEWDPDSKAAKGGLDDGEDARGVPVICRVESEFAIESLEWVVNGEPQKADLGGPIGAKAAFSAFARARLPMERSGWIAARVIAKTADGRPRFAHTAPVYVEIEGKPLRPKVPETAYLLKRVEDEIARQGDALSKEAKAEFEKAAEFYRGKQKEAAAVKSGR
jgi:hypothetical protein